MQRGFTLLEICLAMFIAMIIVTMAVPSLTGVLEGQKGEARFEEFNAMVQEGRLRSMAGRRAWVLEWERDAVVLRPTEAQEGDEEIRFELGDDEELGVKFPAALISEPSRRWELWPSGNGEAAVITYIGEGSSWEASYHPLTMQAEVTRGVEK